MHGGRLKKRRSRTRLTVDHRFQEVPISAGADTVARPAFWLPMCWRRRDSRHSASGQMF